MRRTLLTAGVFALLAMAVVPTPHGGYRFIFSGEDTSIAFFQLLVNVAFAALLGAILATIVPRIATGVRKVPLWAWIIVIAVLVVGAFGTFMAAFVTSAEHAENRGEELIKWWSRSNRRGPIDPEQAYVDFRTAAHYWRLALRFDEATRVEKRIEDVQEHPPPEVRKAKRANIFDKLASEQTRTTTRNETHPLPSPKKYISTDPNAGLSPPTIDFEPDQTKPGLSPSPP